MTAPSSPPAPAKPTILRRLRNKGWPYWVTVVLVSIAGFIAAPEVYKFLNLTQGRYWLFQNLASLSWRAIEPTDVRVVLIGDDDYWKGELEARAPLKRDYLAKVVRALDEADARVIAIDVDMRLSDPRATAPPGDFTQISASYRAETDTFIRAVLDVAQRRKIVLVKPIRSMGNDVYRIEPDTYQLYGLCTGLNAQGKWGNPGYGDFVVTPAAADNISCGYISLPFDMQAIPGRQDLENGQQINSLALSVAQAFRPNLSRAVGAHVSYASYIPTELLSDPGVTVAASKLLSSDPEAKRQVGEVIAAKAVIVGAGWRSLAHRRGPPVDFHNTPVGPTIGPYILANFTEAFLSRRTILPMPHWLLAGFEFVFTIFSAIVLALAPDYIKRVPEFWSTVISIAGLGAVLVFLQWIMLQLFGVFFEAFVPVVALALHAMGEHGFASAFFEKRHSPGH